MKTEYYLQEQTATVKESRVYTPSDIKHLIRETYKDGLFYMAQYIIDNPTVCEGIINGELDIRDLTITF